MQPEQKKSSVVNLAVMGAAVAGCVGIPMLFAGTDVQRNRYASRQACVADYSEAQCNPDLPIGATNSAATYYYGPWYRSNFRALSTGDPGPGRYYRSSGSGLSAPSGVETGTRGGFGHSGRVSASGG